jgi:hypothetical protein
LQAVLTAPWIPRNADKFRANVEAYDPLCGECHKVACLVDRYELSGHVGQFLKDGGRAARYAGFGAAVVDAFYWLRGLLSNCCGFGVSVFSPLYLLIGLLIGALLYGLGLFMKHLFDRWYGHTLAAEVFGAVT